MRRSAPSVTRQARAARHLPREEAQGRIEEQTIPPPSSYGGGGRRSLAPDGGGVGSRNAGFVACLIGVLAMLTGRFVAGAPVWLIYAGVSVIVFGWGLFALSIIKRVRG